MSEYELAKPAGITGVDLLADLNALSKASWQCIEEILRLGVAMGQAEKEYRVKYRERILYERHRGTPVTIIDGIVKGYEDVAELDLKRKIADAQYQANYEANLYYKRQIDTLREQISREWGREYR